MGAESISSVIGAVGELIDREGLTVTVKYGEPLSRHTTFKIGGCVRAMYFPGDARSAVRLCGVLQKQGTAPYILGKGSNVLADDSDLDIIVLNTMGLREIKINGTAITAECGVPLSELAGFAYNHGLTGLEFAHGIPGTLGGAIVMNAGAYGGEMKDVIYATRAFNAVRGEYTVIGSGHEFSYRRSVFSQNGDLVLSADIRLKKGDKDEIKNKTDELNARRRESQPLDVPSAGSFFKRPANGYAAQMIEQSGLKGFAIGAAQVSPKHAGFIINTGGAGFADIMALAEHVRSEVGRQTGISLEPEVKVWKQ